MIILKALNFSIIFTNIGKIAACRLHIGKNTALRKNHIERKITRSWFTLIDIQIDVELKISLT